ncbi:metal ABC transporter solute-binding protein, Zn/Mn family [Actinophytocola gossypii]|uniref:Zinc ABC transporter substrate-binding protein n=1 Tax=Actinophytocola gossypii TaxID=2812003 RepID=A0ABT2J3X8_9PSEU|nr:zinc ABC transporter substrate-binding protein [Actinophytocola gossypii]MCT2582567.1 zinc ABC transporter substrate-binding protein [Actinophytocola gossypii]
MKLTRSAPVAGLALTVLALAGCGSDDGEGAGGDPAAADGTITVVASTNVWGSIAERVGGDAVSVEALITDASADPHAHPDKPSDAAKLADADVAVYNGGGYDEFFTKLVETTGTDVPRVNAFELSAHAEEAGHEGEEEHAHEGEEHAHEGEEHAHEGEEHAEEEHGHGHEHGAVNEHVWYDLETVHKVAERLAEEFGTLAPDHRETFTTNAEALGTELDDLATKAAGIGEANPGAKVVATEPVAKYLLDTAGLTDVTPPEFSEAIEEETDPPLAAVAATTELISKNQVAALVNNSQTETSVTNSLKDAATKAGVPVVDVTETLPEGVTDYVEWMTSAVDALAGALDKS